MLTNPSQPDGDALTSPADYKRGDSPDIDDYVIRQLRPPPSEAEKWLIARTRKLGGLAQLQVPLAQARFLTLLVQAINARQVLEVGTFTGLSTIALAQGVGPEGVVLTCELRKRWADVAREVWEKAGVADRIELWLGPAHDTLAAIPRSRLFDLAFLDGDKPGELRDYKMVKEIVRPGGLIAIDNSLYMGKVAHRPTGNAKAVDRLNKYIREDPDLASCALLPGWDGLTLAQKRWRPLEQEAVSEMPTGSAQDPPVRGWQPSLVGQPPTGAVLSRLSAMPSSFGNATELTEELAVRFGQDGEG